MKLAKVRELLDEKLTEAVMLERERCAKIADSFTHYYADLHAGVDPSSEDPTVMRLLHIAKAGRLCGEGIAEEIRNPK